ncbi:Ig-like domain repeat protein [Rhodococcus sp. IEGM 1379]|uniref:Ig-like domain repeat protein n=1 Tax=Rhodococcus sp. IEGM 1379 TaxID=3047086 RepID=UPI0024B87088|nr:Ig-like domain repeat protein [Rhodococcus sp. IEGM 1379]MDI9919046.1 Ig-like domain repeat protein [Rhodococcus sp. IEGM 1379]
MSINRNLRRLAAGAGAAVLAAGITATFGIAEASAAPANQSTDSGQWTFNRTISNATPSPGETITVTNNIRFNGGLAPTISAFKDIHPACLTYVTDSSRVNGKGVGTNAGDPTFVRMTGSWIRSAVDRNISYSVDYTVGANCARDVILMTGAGISANQGLGSETANAGPTLAVSKTSTQTTVAVSPAPQANKASTLTATVSNNATGTVEFSNNGSVLGTGNAINGTAVYGWTPTGADAGLPFSITAKYLGDATNAVSISPAQTGTVAAAPITPAAPANLAVTPNSVIAGNAVTVSGNAEAGSAVKVTAGDKSCTATADAAGTFHCNIVPTTPGTLTVTATATNIVGTSPVSAPVTVTVTPVPTGTAVITVDPASLTAGNPATISVVGADGGTHVTVKNGSATVCTATADANGTATCTWTPTAGNQTLTAELTVNGAATTITKTVTVETQGDGGSGGSLAGLFGSS